MRRHLILAVAHSPQCAVLGVLGKGPPPRHVFAGIAGDTNNVALIARWFFDGPPHKMKAVPICLVSPCGLFGLWSAHALAIDPELDMQRLLTERRTRFIDPQMSQKTVQPRLFSENHIGCLSRLAIERGLPLPIGEMATIIVPIGVLELEVGCDNRIPERGLEHRRFRKCTQGV